MLGPMPHSRCAWPGLLWALVLGCASSGLGREQHPEGLARILIGEESHVAEICAELEPTSGGGGASRLGPTGAAALQAEASRDACRLASALDAKLRTRCDGATASATIEAAMAEDPPPWLSLVVQSSGAWQGGKFDAAAFASRFDFSRLLARKLAEVGDRAASFSAQVSQSFGRFAGAVQLGVDLLVAEVTAASLERLFDQPAVRALAEPTEVARLACRQLDDGQARPLVTRRILKRAILRLDPPSAVSTPGQLCAAQVRPAGCDRLVGGTRGAAAVASVDATCQTRAHRAVCDHLWFLVAASQAAPLETLCKSDESPRACAQLAKSRRSGQSIDDVCRDARLPHERGRCDLAVRFFAARNLWHTNAAENVCWSNPDRCARIKRHILPGVPVSRPVTPLLEPGIDADSVAVAAAPDIASCFTVAEQVCGGRCPAGATGCDEALSCISAACELVATRQQPVAADDAAAIAQLRIATLAELGRGSLRREDLVPIARGVDAIARADKALVEGVQRLPGELSGALREAVAGMGRGADGDTLRRLEGVLGQIEAKQARRDRARERQRGLADQLDVVARTAGFRVALTDEGVSVILSNVLFEDARSDLGDDARTQVCKVADTLGKAEVTALLGTEWQVEIVGYSSPSAIISSRRKDDSNMMLSLDRAYGAYDWLTKNPDKAESRCGNGRCRDVRACANTIPQDRVVVVGRGYNDGVVGTDEVQRRVEIHVLLPDLDDE